MEHLLLFAPLGIAIIFAGIYMILAKTYEFSSEIILKDSSGTKLSSGDSHIVILTIKKVNGWNKITKYYTVFHYVLNLWSISFTCISLYYATIGQQLFGASASLALLSLTCNLFLRCDRKWATFRTALANGRIETNNFVYALSTTKDIHKSVCEYANKIIEIEKAIRDSDIT